MGDFMSWRINAKCLVVMVVCFILARSLVADPDHPPPSGPPAGEIASEALAREAQTIIDAVLEHHIDPPTRQEMWLAGARALLAKAGVTRHPGLSAKISQLTTAAQFVEFAGHLLGQVAARKSELTEADLRQAFIDGALGAVPNGARLIPLQELTVEEQLQGNRYVGTGIALGYDEANGYAQIASVIPGGPMERAGGRDGDLIFKVDDVDAHGVTVVNMVKQLRGDEGSSLTLVVGAAGENARTIVVTRGPVVLETLAGLRKTDGKWDYRVEPWLPIRCVKVRQINGSTVHDLRVLERQFQAEDVGAIILDFRSTAGSDLHHTVLLADALMDGGLIGRVRTQNHVHEFWADRECLFRDWPMAVLIGRETRGAGEWVAAALQDNRLAVLVGESTDGSASVRSTFTLSGNLGGVSLNTGVFERPSRRPLQKPALAINSQPFEQGDEQAVWGVTPDLPKPAPPPLAGNRLGGRKPRIVGDGAGTMDERDVLRLAVLELRTQIDAGGGRNRQ
jgi:carboxyl-terminal processing protease